MSTGLQLEFSDPEYYSSADNGKNRRQKIGRLIFVLVGAILATCGLSIARVDRQVHLPATIGNDGKKLQLNVAVVGRTSVGKSALVGQFLKESGVVSLETALSKFAHPVETEKYIVNFIEVHSINLQLAQAWDEIAMADAMIVVVSAHDVETTSVLVEETKPILHYASIQGVKNVIVAVNDWESVRTQNKRGFWTGDIKEFGKRLLRVGVRDIAYIPVSTLTGINIFKKSGDFEWFEGSQFRGTTTFSIKDAIDACVAPSRDANGALKVLVGPSVSYVESGTLSSGGKVKMCPSGEVATVGKLQKKNGDSLDTATAGDIVSVSYSNAGRTSSGVAYEESQTCGDKVKSFDAKVVASSNRKISVCNDELFRDNWTATIDLGFQHVPCATEILERWPQTNRNKFREGTGDKLGAFEKNDAVLLRFYPYSDIHIDMLSSRGKRINIADVGTWRDVWKAGAPSEKFQYNVGAGLITSINAVDDYPNFEMDLCGRIPGCWDYWESRTDEKEQKMKFDRHGKPMPDEVLVDCEMFVENTDYRNSLEDA